MYILLALVFTCQAAIVKVFPGNSSGNSIQYPGTKPYHEYSCICISRLNLEYHDYLTLQFMELTEGSSLYFQINHPPYIQYDYTVDNVNWTYFKIVPVSHFNQAGLIVTLHFELTSGKTVQKHDVHFTLVNSTNTSQGSLITHEIDDSYFILIILVGLFSIFFGSFTKLYRFSGFSIKWYHFLTYCITVSVYAAILYAAPHTVFKYFQSIVVGIISLFCSYFFIEQIIGACKLRTRVGRIYLRDIIAMVLAVGMIFLWVYMGNNWVINDILGLMIVGTTIKLVKVGSLRTSAMFVIIILSFNIVVEVVFMVKNNILALRLINDYASPLEFQLPTIDLFVHKRCTWVEITDMIFPGFLINYCRRIDKSLNMEVYSILTYIVIVMSVSIQLLIYVIGSYTIELPQAVFSVPLLMIMLVVVSRRRGEWSIIWYGGFHDKTIQRSSLRRSVEWDSIGNNLNGELLIN